MQYKAIVIGASAGGMEAIRSILINLPLKFEVPIVIVQHLSPNSNGYLIEYLNKECKLTVKEAEDKEKIVPGYVYIAPPNYHVLIENDTTLSLSVEEKVNYARPSIDVLFETAADAYGSELIGIILTGANNDGSKGLRKIKERGGLAIVQDPDTAEINSMPKAAIQLTDVDYILSIDEITKKVIELMGKTNE